MTELILHHYPASPYSEKARLALGLKGLAYRSVRIPAVMPKPDVVALTGGYRRTPLLQIRNDVYCDTVLIAHVLQRLHPSPSLFPHPAAECIAQWADGPLFDIAAGLGTRPTAFDRIVELMLPEELQKFVEDRKAMRVGGHRSLPHYQTARAHLPTYLRRIEQMLQTGPYLLGDAASIADLSVYHCLWFIQLLNPQLVPAEGPIAAWMTRIAAIGHGTPTDMTADEALAVSAGAGESGFPVDVAAGDEPESLIGQAVRVRADDWGRDPVEGTLLAAGPDEMVLQRQDPRAGTVRVHFPRVGFELRAV